MGWLSPSTAALFSHPPCFTFPPPLLRPQGAIDHRIASAVITASECSALLGALLILLSMLGVNIGSALLLPAGIAVAIAAKDLSHNWLAGFFLFVAQVGCRARARVGWGWGDR